MALFWFVNCILVTHYNLAIILIILRITMLVHVVLTVVGLPLKRLYTISLLFLRRKYIIYYTYIILLSRQMFFTRRFRAYPPAYRTFSAEIKRDVLRFSMRITFAAPISPPQNLHNSQFHWVPAIRELRTHFGGPDRISSTI